MPEKSLKETCFWHIASIAIIAALALCGFIYDRASREYPYPTVHVIVHYQPIEQTHFEQWVGEVAISELQGKRSDCSGRIYSIGRPFGHLGIMRNLDELDNLLAKARRMDNKGKRGPLGALAPETLQAIELQTAKEVFSEGRDPFQARLK
jgi:hypothetical protein